MKRTPLFLFLAFSVAFLAGCNNTATTAGLRTELTKVARTNGTTEVSWQLVNPNIGPYLISRSSHKVYLNGTLVGTLEDQEPVAVPAQQRADRRSTLRESGDAQRVLSAAAAAGSASYQIESNLIVQLYGDMLDKANLTASGTVPVTDK